MDILAAYQEVGSYRGAAAMCGTTHKTVRRVVERHNAGDIDVKMPNEATRELLGWEPTHRTLLADLDAGFYFNR
jgi:hypothetical protein